jgi:prevent-host-death family protein
LQNYHTSNIILSEKRQGDDTVNIKPSTALRNEYTQISELAKETGEPIVITNKGEADLVVMSVDAFEEREKMFRHRDKVYEAEIARLNGRPTHTPEQIHAELEALYAAADK